MGMQLNENLDIEDYLADGDGNQLKLSHNLLKTVYDPDECISCEQVDEDENNGDDGNDDAEVEIKEVCENVYMAAAKCEKSHSFDNGYSNYNWRTKVCPYLFHSWNRRSCCLCCHASY